METDWQSKLSLQEAVRAMWEKRVSCDFTFFVGESQTEVACHKFMLTCRSPVLHKMVEGNFADDLAVIPDVDVPCFSDFLEYLYTDEVDMTLDNVVVLLYLAEKYMVSSLFDRCKEFLVKISLQAPECVCDIYRDASLYGLNDLKKDAVDVLRQKSVECLRSESFRELNYDCVSEIMDDNSLNIKEELLFECLIGWAEEECHRRSLSPTGQNIRDVLGGILYKVRFSRMQHNYFWDSVCKKGVLSSDEIKEITNHWRGVGYQKMNKFQTKERNKPRHINRMGSISKDIFMDESKHLISFSSSEDVFLHGLLTYGLCEGNQTFNVQVELMDDNDDVIVPQTTDIWSVEEKQLYEVLFPKAVRIDSDRMYTISLQFNDIYWLWSGENGTTLVECITFHQNRKGTDTTNAFKGQIPGIIISEL